MRRLLGPLRVALAAVLLVAPGAALADVRIEARRHFEAGMRLITRGQLALGIDELQVAYALRPHPHVLFNMARAFQELGNVDEALRHYARYLASDPADAARVQKEVAVLEARRQPPPAPVAVTGSPGAAAAPPPRSQVEELGTLTHRLETALDRLEALGKPAAPPPPGLAAVERHDPGQAPADPGSEARPYEEEVVSATRTAQSTLTAPNSVTVISADDIRQSGATSLVELLRRVPGADVMAMGVNSANISMRGFNQRASNKVLLLIDGRTEYQDFIGLTLYQALPIGLEEIERIEVIRGPGSALYGANATLGLVNIITRRPGSGHRLEIRGGGGSGETAVGSLTSSGTQGGVRYRLGAGYQQADKWSQDYDPRRTDVVYRGADPSLGFRAVRGNLDLAYSFNRQVELRLDGGLNRFLTELYAPGPLRNFLVDGLRSHVRAGLVAGPVRVRAFWNGLSTLSSPQYEAVGQRSIGAHLDSNIFNIEALASFDFKLLGQHRLQFGTEERLKRVGWVFLGGIRSEVRISGFIQEEWTLPIPLQLVASYRVDRHPLLNNGRAGVTHSPRASLVWSLSENQSVRASFATAFREPTFLESYTDTAGPLPAVNGASIGLTGNPRLRPERVTAYELGYRSDFSQLGLTLDGALYANQVYDLINFTDPLLPPANRAFDPVTQTYLAGLHTLRNDPLNYLALGAEVGVRYAPVDGLDLQLAAAYENIRALNPTDDSVCVRCAQTPALKLHASASYRAPFGLELSTEATYVSRALWVERESTWNGFQVASFNYPSPAYVVVHARAAYPILERRLTFAVTGTHLGPSHQQHPFGNLISQRILATVTFVP